jgi:hypothetical protein
MASTFDPKFHDEEAKTVKYLPLGKTDMKVSNLGLGGASFGNLTLTYYIFLLLVGGLIFSAKSALKPYKSYFGGHKLLLCL